jgi:FkbM family methyltransferase
VRTLRVRGESIGYWIWRIRHGVRNRLWRVVLRAYLRPRKRADLVRLGSRSGGWWIPSSVLRPGAVAYCAGAGENVTFDLELFGKELQVTTFDPTPRAIAHVERVRPRHDRFRFEPIGWWDEATSLRFYEPRHRGPDFSALNLHGTDRFIELQVDTVHALADRLCDDTVDLIKMDIEGAEYRVINSLLRDGPLPKVLCVEFDQPQPPRRIVKAVRDLRDAGFELNMIEKWNYTFSSDLPA